MPDKLIAIVPAAGIGQRAQQPAPDQTPQPKQYRLLRGEPMLRHAVRALLADARIERVLVAVAAGDDLAGPALAGLSRVAVRPCGGPTRARTVMAALREAAPGPKDWVLVHDAARPGLPAQALARLIDSCLAHGTGGLLALPVADTVKRAVEAERDACLLTGGAGTADSGYVVHSTVDREALWTAQTPQMFLAHKLLHALEQAQAAHRPVTDEASAMELAGHRPRLVPGSVRNFKVTWPEDFELMEKWL